MHINILKSNIMIAEPIETYKQYSQLYVKNKSKLFPLMQQFTAIKNNAPHSEAITTYLRLLKFEPAFKKQVDKLLFGSTTGTATDVTKVPPGVNGPATDVNPVILYPAKGGSVIKDTGSPYKNAVAADPVTAIAGAIGNIFGTIKADKESEAASDQMFYETVLSDQKKDDTTKILIVTGVTVVILGLGVFFVLKLRK